MLKRFGPSATIAAFLALGVAGHARAGDEPQQPRVSVIVHGHASATADTVEVEFTIDGAAEESQEAKKKYRDKLARVLSTLRGDGEAKAKKKKPKKETDDEAEPKKGSSTKPAPAPKAKKHADAEDEDEPAPKKEAKPKKSEDADEDEGKKEPSSKDTIPIEVAERGLVCGPKAPKTEEANAKQVLVFGMGGGGDNKVEKLMHFSSKVVASIKGVPKLDRGALCARLAGLLDSGIDSGADGADATAPAIRFVCDDPETLRKAAYRDAMKRAKDRAAELAELAGRKLGKVVSVTEMPGAVSVEPRAREAMSVLSALSGGGAGEAAASTIDLAADIELSVTFSLE